MQVVFKQAACIGGKDYKRGTHEVPEEVLAHKFFHKLIKAGLVVEAQPTKVVSAASVQQKQDEFVEKVLKGAQVKKEAPGPAPEESLSAASDPSEFSQEPEEVQLVKAKSKRKGK